MYASGRTTQTTMSEDVSSEVGLALSTPRFALIGGQNPMFGLLCLSAGLCFLSVGLCFGLIYSVPVSTTAGCS